MIQSPWFWLCLAVSVPLYWLIPQRYRLGFLALSSLGYLATLDPLSVGALAAWTALFYLAVPALAMDRPRRLRVLTGLILGVLGFLAGFKYIPPLVQVLLGGSQAAVVAIPLGISYYTFKLIHYAVEFGRGNIEDRSPQQFFCYMFLLPIFTAGPIERFDHFLANQEDSWSRASLAEGLTRIVHGLIKKFALGEFLVRGLYAGVADDTALMWDLGSRSTPYLWGGMLCCYAYLYLDFSAYSDIAIGSSRLFGLRIMENFNFPFVARNISDYWKRWHMTLAGWCQSYVYLPVMGLTRQPYLAALATFVVIGIWHAGTLNRLSWGLYHAGGVVIYMTWGRIKRKKRWKRFDKGAWVLVGIGVTQLFVAASMSFLVVERTHGLQGALRILAKLFFWELPA